MSGPILVIGSLNMDMVLQVPRVPAAGETLAGQSFACVPGGKGANQAAACARLGGQVSMLGRVGADQFGEQLQRSLAQDGVLHEHVTIADTVSTGVALIMVDASAQNRIVIVPGANGTLTAAHIDAAADLIDRAALVVLQLEIPLPVVKHAVARANRRGVPVLLNPAPAKALPSALLSRLEYLIPNATEATLLTGIKVADHAGAAAAARELHRQGAKHVLITLGAEGVLIRDAKGVRSLASPRVAAVDTTAAGDTFIGAFAVSVLDGLSVDEAAQFAVKAAALSVTRPGAQTSIPYRHEIA